MNYTPLEYPADPVFSASPIALGLLISAVLLTIILPLAFRKLRSATFVGSGIVISFIIFSITILAPSLALDRAKVDGRLAAERSWQADTIAEINDRYGIELDEAQFHQLKYPWEKPDPDYRSYGSIKFTAPTENGNLIQTTVYLVWQDEKMILVGSSDEKTFRELKLQE